MTAPPRSSSAHGEGEAGFTLIELIIALALFGLIAVAGLSLVESMLSIRARTDTRLDRLAEIERAMFVVEADLEQISNAPIGETQDGLAFRRHAPSRDGRGEAVRYSLATGTLERVLGGSRDSGGNSGGDGDAADPPRVQHLLTNVASVRWSYYVAGTGWRAGWPPDPRRSDVRPAAVALDVTLGDRGVLRRVVDLPAPPVVPAQ